ncbi:uncharacterized protein CTHT_0008000 [Thermochaetoides thermophila DSM 1495]|uniref:Ribosomal RNA-processing protein 40 n=1 Tax=Chaetomium thermophilum (strain DSM 1495 / CBS 144.50 / IMI 039719) TaxID=759272 RepID=G0RZX8_CHATD|nr:hypothetical protein CTHT_0008000 [Thermochaetoides thermophila DSM 1495]EGS23139.1 hypothetical protein CTHT_0008000 [Thermochaetoides thermophila DSM 1495]
MSTTTRPFVLPGETIDPSLVPTHPKHPLRLGPGLRHVPPSDIIPTVAGQLITNLNKNSMWVEYNSQRYVPTQNDLVLAQVLRSTQDSYLCLITPHTPPATLPHLAFESATKKTRPQLQPGQLVYARVSLANRHMDPELECVNPSTGKADGLGPITGPGCVFEVSLGFARRLLMAKSREEGKVGVLEMLAGEDPSIGEAGAGLAFETAVGRNGRVWVGSEDVKTVIIVGRALQETDRGNLTIEGQRKLVRRLLREMR